jgi:uncharacterized membrane protein
LGCLQAAGRKKAVLGAAAAAIVGSLANSILVLGSLVLLGALPLAAAASVFAANSIVEAILAAVLTAGVVAAWKGIGSKSGKARLAGEEKK